MNSAEISKILLAMEDRRRLSFSISYGHGLTTMARGAYVFQSDEVANPKLLRGINEILHRVFQAIRELETNSNNQFSTKGISHWISCEDRSNDLPEASINAFNRALQKCI